MTDQSLTVLDALEHIYQICTFRAYADDSISRIRDIVRPAVAEAKADNAIATMMLDALQDVLNYGHNGLECNCGDPCFCTCTRAKVLTAIAAAKGDAP